MVKSLKTIIGERKNILEHFLKEFKDGLLNTIKMHGCARRKGTKRKKEKESNKGKVRTNGIFPRVVSGIELD